MKTTLSPFIFSNNLPIRLQRHAAFWLAFYVFSLLTYFHDGFEKIGLANWLYLESTEMFFHIITQMLFCYAILYYLLPKYLDKKRYFAFAVGVLCLSIVVYFIYYWEHILFFKGIHFSVGLPFRPPALVYWFTLISFFTYFPISTGIAMAIKIIKNWYLRQIRNQMLIRENAQTELSLLKAQIHPHFLFNTLNNIYSFALNKSNVAAFLVQKLSASLQYIVKVSDEDWVPVADEIEMIKDYMELEKVRYGNDLAIQLEIVGNYTNKWMTPLLLLPLVENCFKHGTSQVLQQPWIKLHILIEDATFSMQLSNNKPEKSKKNTEKSGIGLQNVQKRLQLLYASNHRFTIQAETYIYSIVMCIPLQDKP